MKHYDVTAICNALVDILLEADDDDIAKLKLNKGMMHLVEQEQQSNLLKHFKNHKQTIELGGSALNTIRALAALDKKTVFAGMIANDSFGRAVQQKMTDLKIKHQLVMHDSAATGSCVVLVTPDGERTMNTFLGASRLFDFTIIPEQEIASSRVFHFCGYQWDSPPQKHCIEEAIKIAKANDVQISFDLADPFVVRHNKDDFVKIIRDHSDIVFANKEESAALFGLSPMDTAQKIAEMGAIAVIKLGADGALIRHKDIIVNIPPVRTQVVDTTAAGDMFAAGFLHGLTSERSLEESGHMAALLASDVISRYGAKLSEGVLQKVRNM